MSISSISSSSVYAAPTSYTDPVNTASETSDDNNDWGSFWTQFDKDSCDDAMSNVGQAQGQEKKNDQEVYHQDG